MSDEAEARAEAASKALEEADDLEVGGTDDLLLLKPFWRGIVVLLRTFTELVSQIMKLGVTLLLAVLAGIAPFVMNWLESPEIESERVRQHEQRMRERELLDTAMKLLADKYDTSSPNWLFEENNSE